MLVSSAVGVMEGLLEQFRPCFSRPQFKNFSTYILGLVACEGRRNVDAINRCFVDAGDQSALNRFLTSSPWSLQLIEAKRLAVVRLYQKFKHQTKPETIYRKLNVHGASRS
ncbi:MAG: hypothetical protein AOA66_1266 [Candidatus Bathyarchaeota archaeon BA2]|nr:MAG: hypothetical protein AOA66_1266 [Candidatus Bathyarchaeota archaeon BA2]